MSSLPLVATMPSHAGPSAGCLGLHQPPADGPAPAAPGAPAGRRRRRPSRSKAESRFLRNFRALLHRELDGRCQDCGRPTRLPDHPPPLDPDHATIDHHVPRSRGGTSDPKNLRLLCYKCNQDKADAVPTWRPKRNPHAPHPDLGLAEVLAWLTPAGTEPERPRARA